nr:MAG TPA: hypothetical protein [Caudoviricetes sp.]
MSKVAFFHFLYQNPAHFFLILEIRLLSNSGGVYDSRSEVRVLCIGGKRARVGAFTIHPDHHRRRVARHYM